VHWGATSQDVADTALILLLKKTVVILEADLLRLEDALQALIAKHRKTMMAGRTLLQSAPPFRQTCWPHKKLGKVDHNRLGESILSTHPITVPKELQEPQT